MKTMFSRFLWLIMLTVSVAVGTQGCTEDVLPSQTKGLELVEEVENLPRSVVDLGYSKLNSEQKVLLWNRRLDKYLQDEGTSAALKEHILKLKAINTVEYFNKIGTEELKEFNSKFIESWYTQPVLKGTFTADQLLDLCNVYRLGRDVADKGARLATEFPSKPKCNCNYRLGCAVRCATGGCATGAANCGVFGSDTCTGHCSS